MKKYAKNAVKSTLSKPLRGRRYRRLLSISVSALLSISTFLTLIPQTETIVYADNVKEITGLCTGSIINPTGAGQWCYVYYGNKIGDNYVRYRVLDKAATEYGGNTMLLDCDYLLEEKRFDDDSTVWANSEIKGYLNVGFLTDKFDAREQAAIAASNKNTASSKDGDGWKEVGTDNLPWTPLVSDDNDETSKTYIFLLDAKEATSTSYGYQNQNTSSDSRKKNPIGTTSADLWWLRSPYYDGTPYAGGVNDSGGIGVIHVLRDNRWLSPAFNINLSSVIFSSLIPNKTNEYKLTVKDENMTIAQTGGQDITRAGNVVTVPYTITGGTPTQVSVLLTNTRYSEGRAATKGYTYLKLNVENWSTSSGTGTFTLPDEYADQTCGTDYYAYILAEDVNGTYETDYASAPASITIPAMPQVATPTFSPAAGTYTEAQNVTISCSTAGATIHYTTDGADPTDASPTYSSAISVRDTTTIKAIAVKDGMTNSSVASATYTISDTPIAVTGVSVAPTEVTLKPDATKKLTATVKPNNASNKDVTWRSDDEDIASVSSDGTVTAKAEGETYITVTTADGNKSAKCKVIVDKDAPVVETCIISFDANGGKGEMDDQTVDKGVATQLHENEFTRDGYTFDSWNTQADGKGKSYDDKDYITVEKDITLYAQWEKGKPRPTPRKHDDDEEEIVEESKPAVVNPDTVEGYFATNGQLLPGVTMGKTKQGVAAQAVFNANRPAGWQEAFTFNMAINGKVDYTLKNGVLTIIIPKEYQKAGRTFAIMALDKNGKAWTFADTDTNPATVTAAINVEGYAFALIYKD